MRRDGKLDSLKGFLIICVAFAHIPYGYFNLESPKMINNLSVWMYFFHIPLFMALSVLFIKHQYSWLIKRASLILLPYLFWYSFGHNRMLFDSPIEFIGGVLIGNWSTIKSIIWFLPALFSLNLLYFFFEKSDKYIKYLIFGLSIITFIFASKVIVLHYNIPFGFDVGLYIFLLAYIVKYIYKHQEKFIGINLVLMIIAILVASISLFYYEPIKTHTEYHLRIDLAQFSVPITLIGYLSFILLNISILIVFLKIKEISLLTTVGNYSYPIFLFHSVILYKLPSLIKFDSLIINIIFLVSTFILSITLPIIGSKFIMRLSNNFKYIGMVK